MFPGFLLQDIWGKLPISVFTKNGRLNWIWPVAIGVIKCRCGALREMTRALEKRSCRTAPAAHCMLQDSTVVELGGGFKMFQIYIFIFTPTWGNDPIWRAYFSDGLVQPPTSESLPTYHCTSHASISFERVLNLRFSHWLHIDIVEDNISGGDKL